MITDDNIHVLKFDELSTSQLYDILWLRAKVFVEDQGCPYLDLDYVDQKSMHCLLYENDALTAYARVIPAGAQHDDVSIGRVVTSRQGEGYGYRIFRAAMQVAVERFKAERIEITSQAYIRHFYEKFGFRATSGEFMMEFRPHLTMLWEKTRQNEPK